jgi:hypothetical protein
MKKPPPTRMNCSSLCPWFVGSSVPDSGKEVKQGWVVSSSQNTIKQFFLKHILEAVCHLARVRIGFRPVREEGGGSETW